MTIDLIWYFDKAEWVYPLYRDGVKAAMEVLKRRGHTVRWHLGLNPQIPDDSDFILNWDNSTSEFIPKMRKYKARKGLILTTDLGLDVSALRNYDIIFPEAQCVVDKIRPHGIRAIRAFGTDTNFFKPFTGAYKRNYKAFYPATFSPWKRQDIFARKWRDRGLCLGTVQPDGWDILRRTVKYKTNVYIGYVPVTRVKAFYFDTESVDITGWEGSGRTVIEALSMGLEVTAADDNHKCQEYIKGWKESKMKPREFAIAYYSAETYADQLLKGILE